jgi:hypothetical protein
MGHDTPVLALKLRSARGFTEQNTPDQGSGIHFGLKPNAERLYVRAM